MQPCGAEVLPKRVAGLAGPIRAFRPDNKSERNMSGCECKRDSVQPSIKGRCTNIRFGVRPPAGRTPMISQAVFALLFATAATAAPISRNPDTVYDLAAERTFAGMVARSAHSIDGIMYFTLKTADADVEVQLGPRSFV